MVKFYVRYHSDRMAFYRKLEPFLKVCSLLGLPGFNASEISSLIGKALMDHQLIVEMYYVSRISHLAIADQLRIGANAY